MSFASVFRIAGRELRSYFFSPIAYIVIVVFLVVTGWFFFSVFFLAGRADLRDFFNLLPLVLSLVVPALTMRLLSEEYSTGSMEILLTLPVRTEEVLLGKYLASLGFSVAMLLPTLAYPLTVARLGELDWGPVWGGYLAGVFLAGLFCAAGLFASSLSRNQIVAFIIGVAICFFLSLLEQILPFIPDTLAGTLQWVAATAHFQNSARGILDSRDLLYFLSGSFLFLHFTDRLMRGRG